jgi:hypothetical protein
MQRVYDLFAGEATPENVLSVGKQEGDRGRFYSHLYVGLYFEALAEPAQAQQNIDVAVQIFRVAYQTDDYMGYLAEVYQYLRGWGEG